MHHGVADLDTRWVTVEDQPPGLLLKNLDQFSVGCQIVFIAENCRCQMSIEGTRCA